MTSMSYVFTKLMGSVLFEVFLIGKQKVLAEKASNFLLPRISRERKIFKGDFIFEFTMKEPERITPFRLSGIRVLQLQEFR